VRAALAAVALLTIGLAQAEGQGMDKLPYGGSEAFRFALHLNKLKPVSQPLDALQSPSDSIIVISGDTSSFPVPINGARLKQFLDFGGAILVASDTSSDAWGNQFGLQITGRRLEVFQLGKAYHHIGSRPFVKPRPGVPGAADSPFAIFRGIEETGVHAVATDSPSEMQIGRPRNYLVKDLAGYVDGTRPENQLLPITDANNHFAVSIQPGGPGNIGTGRMLVMADNSVFINGMMRAHDDPNVPEGFSFDNANWRFTNQTIEWLKGGGPEPRTQCLFIEDGMVINAFAKEVPQPPSPPKPKITPEMALAIANIALRVLNDQIPRLEERDYFNRVLERWLGLPLLLRRFLICVTILLLVTAFGWLARSSRKQERAAALSPAMMSAATPKGGLFRQRTAAQIDVGNLHEAARRRIRSAFDLLGARPGSPGRMPPILTASDIGDGPMLHQTVRRLWLLGYSDQPASVAPADWDRVNALLERLVLRAAKGDWSFGQEVG
jgi:hypothetical protein